ncbi:AHH domain-containing protein [Acidovorax sp. LjRoot117]|uniref:AHH domain-containing protein n=1 Tax=Acidovorax sp. LjRoot117 TaxID=3342255 RepID=UPI003F501EC2
MSQDPIGLAGGANLFAYAPNRITLSDPSGLDYRSTFWDAVGHAERDKYQVHHIIPQAVYDKHTALMNCAGIKKDEPDNLIGLPKKAEHAGTRTGRYFGTSPHNTSHSEYSKAVNSALNKIAKLPTCAAKKAGAKALQETLREALRRKGSPLMNREGSTEGSWGLIINLP